MDAFAVSICKGLSVRRLHPAHMLSAAVWFGGFQALMPLLGYFLGIGFADMVQHVDHWIAFVLLGIIGGKMIHDARQNDVEEYNPDFSIKTMFLLAVATSIDAFAVGLTYAILSYEILIPSVIIGVVAFLFTLLGIFLGKKIGNYLGDKFQIVGGIILILIGIKILLGF